MFHRDKIIHKGHRRTPWSSEVPQVSQSISFDDVKSVNSCPNDIILGRPRSGERLTQLMHLINEGDYVCLESPRGKVDVKARLTDEVKEGILSTTFHFPEIMINNITGDVHDSEAMCPEYKVVAVRVRKSKGKFKQELI